MAAPSLASDNAMPAPIPFDAPVTNAIFPSSFPIDQSPRFDDLVSTWPAFHDRPAFLTLLLALPRPPVSFPCRFPFDAFQIEHTNREGFRFYRPDLGQRQ